MASDGGPSIGTTQLGTGSPARDGPLNHSSINDQCTAELPPKAVAAEEQQRTLAPENEGSEAEQAVEGDPQDGSLSTLKRKRQNHQLNGEFEDIQAKASEEDGEEEGEQPKQLHPLWKTSLCSYFRRSASCSHGSNCRYAHGEAELRPRPDNTWDPTSEKGKSTGSKRMKPLLHNSSRMETVQDILACSEDEDGDGASGGDPSCVQLDKCIVGIPLKWTAERLKAFLEKEGVSCKTVRKKKGMTVGFMGFEDYSQLNNAMKGLSEKSVGGKDILIADVIRKSYVQKAKDQHPVDGIPLGAAENSDGLGSHAEEAGPKTRTARDMVVPLAHMPYAEQLEFKKNSLAQILKKLTRNARKACPGSITLPGWIHKSREIGGLPCVLEGLLPSPSITGYRNKCEFTVGHSLDGKRTVGFALGNFREGMIAVEEPSDCPNISTISCKYAKIFQEFLESSTFPVWNRLNNSGFWRQLTVREGRDPRHHTNGMAMEVPVAEVMLIIQVCSLEVDAELMKSEFKRMVKSFAQGASSCSPPLPLTSVIVQDHMGICNAAPADCPLFPLSIPFPGEDSSQELVSEARIHDFLCNLKFCISPTAFFQVNTLAAEKLYSLAGDWANLTANTLLFDICCGTGTIGLTLAHRVGLVVGIEMNHSAVRDAQRNADINCITNCRFVCAKAEDVISVLLKEYLSEGPEQGTDSDIDDVNDTSNEVDYGACQSTVSPEVNETASEARPSDHNKSSACLLKSCTTENKETGEEFGIKEKKGISTPLKQFEDVVVIVDPPRAGLHPTVIKALRTHPRLRRLVYISCNPETLVANAIELCTPTSEDREKSKGNRGWRKMSSAGLARQRTKSMPHSEPFQPIRAVAVDMFPHTPHCEMVMLFER